MSEGQRRSDPRHAEGPVVGLTGARFGGAKVRRLRKGDASSVDAPPVATLRPTESEDGGTEDVPVQGPIVGLTGARFAPAQRKRRSAESEPDQQDPQPPVLQPQSVAAGLSDADESVDDTAWLVDDTDWEGSEQSYDLVRPYSWTAGRTTSRWDLALETLISASGRLLDQAASPEHHTIVRLCSTPRSVAELAALLSVPLGVARVLLGDMAEAGSVMVHRTAMSSGNGTPDLALMHRVLTCLQRL